MKIYFKRKKKIYIYKILILENNFNIIFSDFFKKLEKIKSESKKETDV